MYFTKEKIKKQLKEIRATIHREIFDLPDFRYFEAGWEEVKELDEYNPQLPQFDDGLWERFRVGSFWGGYDRVAWFRAWVSIPREWREQKLGLRFLVGPRDGGGSTAETMVYVNGEPLQGIDVWHEEAWLPPEATQSGAFFLALKAWSGVLQVPERRRFQLAQLVWIDEPTERFYFLADTVLKAVHELDEKDLRSIRLLEGLNEAFKQIDWIKPRSPTYYASIQKAGARLQESLAALEGSETLRPKVTGIGQAHIDMAWLWRLEHSREKAARTFATALHMMRQYPEYRFMHSSPQLYKFLAEDHPDLFARVKEKIASGQWEITGGMWVEADTNLTSGESLIRQLLLGRRYVRATFGVEMNVLWLPDVFGYSAALPQIVKKSGMEYFLTTKISWSQFNRFPYDTFRWRGIDGSELLTHFVTTPDPESPFFTYNGRLNPMDVRGIWEKYQQKNVNDELLLLYGWGDGGGGPTREMIESGLGMKDLPGIPQVSLGTAEAYFSRLGERLDGKALPVWDGELYLEYHRGTYTSQAYNKRANRKAEILFHNAEWLSSLADVLAGESLYPAAELNQAWERILLNQFHDILPGSSIRQVYEDCHADYGKIFAAGQSALAQAAGRIRSRLGLRDRVLALNPLSWPRTGLLEIPWQAEDPQTVVDEEGKPVFHQVVNGPEGRSLLVESGEVPALGFTTRRIAIPAIESRSLEQSQASADARSALMGSNVPLTGARERVTVEPGGPERQADEEAVLHVSPQRLENRFYRLQLNEKGQIISVWDKIARREVIDPKSPGNRFQAFEDKPMNFDAWDIDIYYQEKKREVDALQEAVVEETGPLRGVLRLCWRFSDSTITQRLTIYRNSKRIDFRTEVDWHEHQVLLKVAFPVQVRSTRATYDIQFGNVERPTHWNTSWDAARFEVVGHKWVDLSEGDYGVALLNDCKYGHDVKDNVMRLTLIKSGIEPDPQADQGRHEFTYSLLPHTGDWRTGGVVEQGYDLNNPLLALPPESGEPGENLPASPVEQTAFSFASVEEGLILETVKKAEQGDGWVVRLYETRGSRKGRSAITFGRRIRKAVECNLMEEDEQPAEYDASSITFSITPYEIKTFIVWF